MSLESADPHDSGVRREKSNLGKIRGKRVIRSPWRHHLLSSDFTGQNRYISHNNYFFVAKDDRSWWTKKVYIGNIHRVPKKTDLHVGPHQHKRNNPRFSIKKHDLPYIFPKLILFSHHNLSRQHSRRSGYYFIDIFTKETWMGVSMNEASSTPKAMKWRALCVFKVFLTIYPRPAVRWR